MQALVVTIPGCVRKRMLPPFTMLVKVTRSGFTATKTLRYLGPANGRTAICVVQKHRTQNHSHGRTCNRTNACRGGASCARRVVAGG